MSVLMDDTITQEDLGGGRGKPLPTGVEYQGVFVEHKQDHKENGVQQALTIGNISTVDGRTEFDLNGSGTYRIGNRKVFVRCWSEQKSEEAQRIGHAELKRIAVATGLVATPQKGEKVTLPTTDPEELAQSFVGRTVKFTVKHVTRKKAGKVVFEDDGETPKVDVEVARWL